MPFTLTLFEEVIKWGFTISLPILLLAYFIRKQWRPFAKRWLLGSYLLVFVYFVVEITGKLVMITEQLVIGPKDKSVNSFYQFSTTSSSIRLYILFSLLLQVSFIQKRVRNSMLWGILSLIVIQTDDFTLTALSFYRKYMPGSWSYYYNFPFNVNRYIFCTITFNLLVSGLYYFRKLWIRKMGTAV